MQAARWERTQPWGLTRGKERYHSLLVSTPCPSTTIVPSKPDFQRTSGSPDQAYLEPHYADIDNRPVFRPSAFNLPKVIWKGIVIAPADDSLAEEVQTNGKGKMYTAHRSGLHCKDRCLQSLEATWASTLACTSDQFRSSGGRARTTPWGYGRVPHSSGKVTPAERYLSRHLTADLHSYQGCSWSLLSDCTSQPPFSQPLYPDTKTVISSAYADNVCRKRARKKDAAQGRTCLLIHKPTERGSKETAQRTGDRGLPCRTKPSIAKVPERIQFTCTTVCGLWYNMLIRLRNSALNPAVSKTVAKTVNDIQGLGLIYIDQHGFSDVFYCF